MQTIVETIQGPHSETSITRERRYAHGEDGGAIDLSVSREDGVFSVNWNANRGRGWFKGWRKGRLSEEQANALVADRWAHLCKWLRELEPERSGGAVEAFSREVATMIRR